MGGSDDDSESKESCRNRVIMSYFGGLASGLSIMTIILSLSTCNSQPPKAYRADLNGDAYTDLVTFDLRGERSIYLGQEDGSFVLFNKYIQKNGDLILEKAGKLEEKVE